MSFYTGKPDGTNPICHVTKGQHSIETMRGNPIKETIFHTNIRYMDFKIYDLSTYTRTKRLLNRVVYNTGYVMNAGKDVYLYRIDGELYDRIISGDYAWSLYETSTGKIYSNVPFYHCYPFYNGGGYAFPQWVQATDSCLWASLDANVLDSPSDTSCFNNIPKLTATTGYHYLVLDDSISVDIIVWGVKNSSTYVPLTNQSRAGEILLNRTKFQVGAVDVVNTIYLATSKINEVDLLIKDSNSNILFQLVNSISKTAGVEIISNNTETTIKKGGHKIISTTMGSPLVNIVANSYKTFPVVTPIAVRTGTTYTQKILLYNRQLSLGTPILLSIKFGESLSTLISCFAYSSMAGTRASSSSVFKYKEGYIYTFTSFYQSDAYSSWNTKLEIHGTNGYLYGHLIHSYTGEVSGEFPLFSGTVGVNELG